MFIRHLIPNTRNKKLILVVSLALVVLTCAIVFWLTNKSAKPPAKVAPVTFSTDKPSETKVDEDTYVWPGSSDEPKYISLPSIGAGGYIQKVGVDQNKQIAVTTSIYFAGWFADSANPGQHGLSIIDGHVTGRKNDGIFKDLKDLEPGDTYTIETGGGAIKQYEVTKIMTVDTKDAVNYLFSQEPKIASQLNLITCGGEFDKATQQYKKRVIVYSKLSSLES